ncbi:MAG: plasmid mobilization relaxosome protein MobC [Oscillospiraceae bacterium]|nr:plasmid mobilization relaxosome protein MobC [Oscillospiraceae bacterium]
MRKRNVTITIRCTEEERNHIYQKVKQHNLKLNDFILRSAMDKKIINIDGLSEVMREQKAIGRNLNQIAMLAHEGRLKAVQLDKLIEQHNRTTTALCEIVKAVN